MLARAQGLAVCARSEALANGTRTAEDLERVVAFDARLPCGETMVVLYVQVIGYWHEIPSHLV